MAVEDDELFVPTKVRCMAAVFVHGDAACYLIAETPERAHEAQPDHKGYVQFTLANDSDWNGRKVFVKHEYISSISPSPEDNKD